MGNPFRILRISGPERGSQGSAADIAQGRETRGQAGPSCLYRWVITLEDQDRLTGEGWRVVGWHPVFPDRSVLMRLDGDSLLKGGNGVSDG